MEGVTIETALRMLLLKFKLPGEAQKIDRLLDKFARRYHLCNPEVFSKSDTAYVISFSIVLLNTDLHNPSNAHRMSKESFIANNRRIDGGDDLSESLLSVNLQ
jgi:brefeldin A-inhibited guanine nucleotide-exchange protein